MKGRLYDPRIARFTTTDLVIANVYNGQAFNKYASVSNNPLTSTDPSGFTEEETWRLWRVEETPGQLGIRVTFDKLTPREPRSIAPLADVGANAPTNDVSTIGTGSTVELPVIETDHPSGPGTDDPFGVYPTDIELAHDTPATTFEQLIAGDPAVCRTKFIIEDEPGIGRDLRIVFGPERQMVMLGPRIGGEARTNPPIRHSRVSTLLRPCFHTRHVAPARFPKSPCQQFD